MHCTKFCHDGFVVVGFCVALCAFRVPLHLTYLVVVIILDLAVIIPFFVSSSCALRVCCCFFWLLWVLGTHKSLLPTARIWLAALRHAMAQFRFRFACAIRVCAICVVLWNNFVSERRIFLFDEQTGMSLTGLRNSLL